MSIAADNKAIKIPETHYVGFQKRGENEIPLGFMTPDGEDAGAVKRKATVDSWASSGYHARQNKAIPAQSFENKPMLGFKMGQDVRHGYGWGQGSVKWRIEDPRGFELEISSPNFAQIISLCTLEQGEIQERCVWGRLGNENILIPVNSDVYKAAQLNTARLNTSASMKDLNLGDYAVMQNGDEGFYMGYFYPIGTESYSFKPEDKKRHFFGVRDDAGKYTSFHVVASPKLSEIRPSGLNLTNEAAEQQLNQALDEQEARNGYRSVVAVSIKKPKLEDHQTLVMTKETGYAEAYAKTLAVSDYRYHLLVHNPVDGRWGVAQGKYYIKGTQVLVYRLDHARWLADNSIEFVRIKSPSRYYYSDHYTNDSFEVDHTDTQLEWYTIEGSIATTTGHVVTRRF